MDAERAQRLETGRKLPIRPSARRKGKGLPGSRFGGGQECPRKASGEEMALPVVAAIDESLGSRFEARVPCPDEQGSPWRSHDPSPTQLLSHGHEKESGSLTVSS